MLENGVFNRPYVRDITKICECACSMNCDKNATELRPDRNPDIITNIEKKYLREAAIALSTLQTENEKLRNEVERQRRSADDRKHLYENAERAYMKVVAELEQVKAELNAAKSPEVLEAVDELMEFARTRMSTADWLYYVDVLGEWRGPQKED